MNARSILPRASAVSVPCQLRMRPELRCRALRGAGIEAAVKQRADVDQDFNGGGACPVSRPKRSSVDGVSAIAVRESNGREAGKRLAKQELAVAIRVGRLATS
jgi:hypothetical protein